MCVFKYTEKYGDNQRDTSALTTAEVLTWVSFPWVYHNGQRETTAKESTIKGRWNARVYERKKSLYTVGMFEKSNRLLLQQRTFMSGLVRSWRVSTIPILAQDIIYLICAIMSKRHRKLPSAVFLCRLYMYLISETHLTVTQNIVLAKHNLLYSAT